MNTPRRRAARPLSLLLSPLLVVALAATGCSGDDDGDGAAPAASPTASESGRPAPEVRTKVAVGRVPGHLPPRARKRAVHAVGDVVDHWFDAAYVGGRYPRHDFSDAYPAFTAGARADAVRDRDLMTNRPLGREIDGVTAHRRLVWVDLLPARGRAAAATARFRLAFTTTGEKERSVVVRGRLFLVPGPSGWKVFGYDVAKGTPDELEPKERPSKGKPSKHGAGKHHEHSGKDHQKGGGR
ncbi:hypothetical protein ACT8ZV_04835 [Nocardioides sp. MAHUQ-72]|uniref:hypothetical protein n=1 Tax=unclassified Nocardioides TaxID=2615069 RepID=UPI003618DCC1